MIAQDCVTQLRPVVGADSQVPPSPAGSRDNDLVAALARITELACELAAERALTARLREDIAILQADIAEAHRERIAWQDDYAAEAAYVAAIEAGALPYTRVPSVAGVA